MKWIRLGLMKTYSASSWRLRMKKMMPMMRPMKRREPAMPPMTAPVDGPGVIVLFSSATGERHIEEGKQREREGEIFISNSFKCHATACGTLMLLTCNICFVFFMCFAAEVCVRENS